MNGETLYEIRDAHGVLRAMHRRLDGPDGKLMSWRGPDGSYGLGGVRVDSLPLYRSELVAGWPIDTYIVVTEGESDCDALTAIDGRRSCRPPGSRCSGDDPRRLRPSAVRPRASIGPTVPAGRSSIRPAGRRCILAPDTPDLVERDAGQGDANGPPSSKNGAGARHVGEQRRRLVLGLHDGTQDPPQGARPTAMIGDRAAAAINRAADRLVRRITGG